MLGDMMQPVRYLVDGPEATKFVDRPMDWLDEHEPLVLQPKSVVLELPLEPIEDTDYESEQLRAALDTASLVVHVELQDGVIRAVWLRTRDDRDVAGWVEGDEVMIETTYGYGET